MKKPMEVVPKSATGAVALGTAGPADPEVVAVARRQQFSPSEKGRIRAAADRCITAGSKGALLRREGIYSSHLRTWRRQRDVQEAHGLEGGKRGPKVNPTASRRPYTMDIRPRASRRGVYTTDAR